MSRVLRYLRNMLLWVGPIIVLLIALVAGFVYWCMATEPGTRWTLQTVTRQLDGHVDGAQGTLWAGVRVQDLAVTVADVVIRAKDLQLEVDWVDITRQRLHLHNMSAETLDVDLTHSPDSNEPVEPSQPFTMPAIPFGVAVDRLALGSFNLRQDGKPLAVGIQDVVTSVALTQDGANVVVKSLQVDYDSITLRTHGEIHLLDLNDPWPVQARFTTHAVGQAPESPLCARRFVPTLPAARQVEVAGKTKNSKKVGPPFTDSLAKTDSGQDAIVLDCSLDVESTLSGSFAQLQARVSGHGQGLSLDADATILPRAAFPFRRATVSLQLPDGSSLDGNLDWETVPVNGVPHDRVTGALHSKKLDVGHLVGSAIPPAVITAAVKFDAQLLNHRDLIGLNLDANFDPDSRWNKQPLSGALKLDLDNRSGAQSTGTDLIGSLRLANVAMDLALGNNHVRAQGSLGGADSRLDLDVSAPRLASFWPDIPGGLQVQGQVAGSVSKHAADLNAVYSPDNKTKVDDFASAPTTVHLKLAGGWATGPTGEPNAATNTGAQAEMAGGAARAGSGGWSGSVSDLRVSHAGLSLRSQAPVPIAFDPGASAPRWQWQVGKTALRVDLSSQAGFVIDHQASRGGPGRWETKGGIDKLTISQEFIQALQTETGSQTKQRVDQGGIEIRNQKKRAPGEIVLSLDWDLKFSGVLTGGVHVDRVSGDLTIPAEPGSGRRGVALGLQAFSLDLNATKASASASRIDAKVNIATANMGKVSANGQTLLRVGPDGSFILDKNEPKTVSADLDISDLDWVNLFLGDAMELGGSLTARLQAKSDGSGTWSTGGTISGRDIRLVRVDDGVRLLNGTLKAHLDNSRLILDSLSFPALLRVAPNEWRTQEWITTNPDAKNGSLTLSGYWNLFESSGQIKVKLHRYPILQRSDRYAMVTGNLVVDAQLPKVSIVGGITVDAGWFDLDMLSSIPTVDSDVVVIRAGEEKKDIAVPSEVSMDLTVDLGPRFYLTGYGVNSGLVGSVRIIMANGRLTGQGMLRTRGGAIEAYGQRLQLRRGTITFQGDIMSPVLSIEALRTGGAVEAGVRVAGTARRPRIDLVSYPDVSEVEKLSWLLLGRPPDEGGGDAALLFSVGTSLVGGGKPFYRELGLDEVSIRSGELGSTGSILPAESVVSGLNDGTSNVERKFIVASKTLGNGITLSIRQALSDTGTLARASYQLARGLTAEISVGTVSGVALVYRFFFKD